MEIEVKEYAVNYTVMKYGVCGDVAVRCNETGYVWDSDMRNEGVNPDYRSNGELFNGHPCILGRTLPYVAKSTKYTFPPAHIVEMEETVNKQGERCLTIRTVVGTWVFIGVSPAYGVAKSVNFWSR